MHTHSITSDYQKTPALAAISAIRKSIKTYANNAQAVHIIIANIIESDRQWKALVSVIRIQDQDTIYEDAIIFGHLPAKYEELYDDLLSEVDHLNLIDDISIWQNIKNYLLDVYFYQAVHFGKVERIQETGGGYFQETKKKNALDVELKIEKLTNNILSETEVKNIQEHFTFQQSVKADETKILNEDRDILVRNIRENKKIKNLIVELKRSF